MITQSDRVAAGARYAAAIIELRAALGDLAAFDSLFDRPTFGPMPEIVPFRHPEFAPGVSGSFIDDIDAAFQARSRA